jgi:hypothetical protein
MLSPIHLGKDLWKIPRVSELLLIVAIVKSNVPPDYVPDACNVLSDGANKAFNAAGQHALNAAANPESDFGRKSKRHRDDLLKLFSACFSGCCELAPEENCVRSTASAVLTASTSAIVDSMQALCTDATLCICQAIEENKSMNALIISIFPQLCGLIMSDNTRLKKAAVKVLTDADISATLQATQARCEDAERRAAMAEKRVAELEGVLHELQEEKSQLQQELAVAKDPPRRGLW